MSRKRNYASSQNAPELCKTKKTCLRNKKGEIVFEDFIDFLPNKTPEEVLQEGSFGGTYFRPIRSSVTNERYKEAWKDLPESWLVGLKVSLQVASPTYDKNVNKYKVKCGASLEEWERSGWIKAQDPYGWFQWYCRFYQGRRSSDDERQVGRWKRFLARFKSNLVNKIRKANTTYNDFTISPVIRQSLLHWGYEIVEADMQSTKMRQKDTKKLIGRVPLI